MAHSMLISIADADIAEYMKFYMISIVYLKPCWEFSIMNVVCFLKGIKLGRFNLEEIDLDSVCNGHKT